MAAITNETFGALRSQIRGQVLLPGETGYDAARTIWNAMIDRKPALIVRCAGVADVIRSLAFARDHDLLLSVRGGGHNIAGNAVCDGGLMIDLSLMRSVRVDPQSHRAYVEPGATLADFDHEAQAFGLATPLGINSTTGVAGLTLGGGFGWLTRKFGMSIDNLLAADVVTADGRLLHANVEEDPDLFWAVRGGGGNFGIVTMFEFQLHLFGPEVYSGLLVFPFAQAGLLLRKYRQFVDEAPEDVNMWALVRRAPPLPFLPAEVHGQPIVAFPFLYTGDVAAGAAAIEPARGFGQLLGEHIGPQPFTAWQKAFDPLLAPGSRNYWKSHNFQSLSDGAIDAVIDCAKGLPNSRCEIFVGLLSGQANRVPADATAYAHRDTKFVLNVHTRWDSPDDDQKCVAWARDFFNATAPYASRGVYVNFMSQDETARIPAAYGSNYDRLVRLKGKYDPTNLFRLNQNLKPG